MRPSFVKQDNFDSEMTKFAGKYTLYLYREKGVDNSDQVRRKKRFSKLLESILIMATTK